ncbi:MAG: hypothetical protein AAB966_04575 [Patescibacteria group bacterium]
MQILGGVVENIIYRSGLPCMVLSLGKGVFKKFNIYLNPSIRPWVVRPEGKEILLVVGDFLPQDASIFSPNLIIEWGKGGLIEHQLFLD